MNSYWFLHLNHVICKLYVCLWHESYLAHCLSGLELQCKLQTMVSIGVVYVFSVASTDRRLAWNNSKTFIENELMHMFPNHSRDFGKIVFNLAFFLVVLVSWILSIFVIYLSRVFHRSDFPLNLVECEWCVYLEPFPFEFSSLVLHNRNILLPTFWLSISGTKYVMCQSIRQSCRISSCSIACVASLIWCKLTSLSRCTLPHPRNVSQWFLPIKNPLN